MYSQKRAISWKPRKGYPYWHLQSYCGKICTDKTGYYYFRPEETRRDIDSKNYFKSKADGSDFIEFIIKKFHALQYRLYGIPTQLDLFCNILPLDIHIDFNNCFHHKIENFYTPERYDKYFTIGITDGTFFIYSDRFIQNMRLSSNVYKQGICFKSQTHAEEGLDMLKKELGIFNLKNYCYTKQEELFNQKS